MAQFLGLLFALHVSHGMNVSLGTKVFTITSELRTHALGGSAGSLSGGTWENSCGCFVSGSIRVWKRPDLLISLLNNSVLGSTTVSRPFMAGRQLCVWERGESSHQTVFQLLLVVL